MCENVNHRDEITRVSIFFSTTGYFKYQVKISLLDILIYIQQDATLHSLFYPETALHVSGVPPPIIRSAYSCIYSIWYLSHRYCHMPLAAGNSNMYSSF